MESGDLRRFLLMRSVQCHGVLQGVIYDNI